MSSVSCSELSHVSNMADVECRVTYMHLIFTKHSKAYNVSISVILFQIIFDKHMHVFQFHVFHQRGWWRCIRLSGLTNYLLKPQQMVLNFSDIIACLQLCQPGGLAGGSVDVCNTPVMDTGSCLGFKEHLDLLNKSPPSPWFINTEQRVSIVSHSLSYLQTKWPVRTLKGKLHAFLHNRKRYLHMLSK